MKEPEGKQEKDAWHNDEVDILYDAVGKYGRDWKSVASMVGTRTNQQCKTKVDVEVKAGRMKEPEGKKEEGDAWLDEEVDLLHKAVEKYGRDWVSVAGMVGARTNEQCRHKVNLEVKAGRMKQPEGK